MADTVFVKNRLAGRYLEEQKENCVIKAVDGHGGTQVYLVSPGELFDTKEKLGSSDAVIQPLIGSRHEDLRIYVLGKTILAAVLRKAEQGFKSNFSLGGSVRLYELSTNEKELVDRITGLFDFGLVGIDFIIGDDGTLLFNEIEDVVGARMLYQCMDIDLVRDYLLFIIENIRITKGHV